MPAYRLNTIGIGVTAYAFRHDGHTPPSLTALLTEPATVVLGSYTMEAYAPTAALVFPGCGLDPPETTDPEDVESHTAYVLACSIQEENHSELAIAFSMPAMHDDRGAMILDVDGSVSWSGDLSQLVSSFQDTNDYLAGIRAGDD